MQTVSMAAKKKAVSKRRDVKESTERNEIDKEEEIQKEPEPAGWNKRSLLLRRQHLT